MAIDRKPDANLRLPYGMPLEQVLAAQPERGQPREPIRRGRWSDKEPDWVMEGVDYCNRAVSNSLIATWIDHG